MILCGQSIYFLTFYVQLLDIHYKVCAQIQIHTIDLKVNFICCDRLMKRRTSHNLSMWLILSVDQCKYARYSPNEKKVHDSSAEWSKNSTDSFLNQALCMLNSRNGCRYYELLIECGIWFVLKR